MYYKLSALQERELLSKPETGMGYQIIEATTQKSYKPEKFIILNAEMAIELDGLESIYVRKVINEGIYPLKASATLLTLNSIRVLNENQFRNVVNENKAEKEKGAIDNRIEYADGQEVFVRLSAFDNDRRVDKENNCLLPGSFTTTQADYNKCKETSDDPVERYALPNNEKIKFAFFIQPKGTDPLQRGTVQPANNKRGGRQRSLF
ncbi:hypothetical protein BH09BAC2_BH09BAC2_03600 [soil metagenome]